jgi:hypothetical protein
MTLQGIHRKAVGASKVKLYRLYGLILKEPCGIHWLTSQLTITTVRKRVTGVCNGTYSPAELIIDFILVLFSTNSTLKIPANSFLR